MSESFKQEHYAEAWHGEQDYSPQECMRLQRACELFAADADRRGVEPYKLLDVGCGVGPLHRWLEAGRVEITGLEISERAAEQARQNYHDCLVMDVETDWPVPPGSFHGVHMGAIMEHVLDWHAPLNQANTALAEGGLLVICVPNLRYWREIRRLIAGRQPHWLRDMGHVPGYPPKFLKQLVTIHGFEVQALRADRLRLPFTGKLSRLGTRRLAGFGAVLVLAARRVRPARVVDATAAPHYPDHKPVACRAIEVPADG